MEFNLHIKNEKYIAELQASKQVINKLQDAVDLLGNADYQGARSIVVKKEQLHPDFFKLATGLAGDILQKFSNYRMRLAIVGDFSEFTSKPLKDFIFESNKLGSIIFVATLEEALDRF